MTYLRDTLHGGKWSVSIEGDSLGRQRAYIFRHDRYRTGWQPIAVEKARRFIADGKARKVERTRG